MEGSCAGSSKDNKWCIVTPPSCKALSNDSISSVLAVSFKRTQVDPLRLMASEKSAFRHEGGTWYR